VADGVGSMAQFKRHGVDAAAYSADLMQIASEATSLAETARGKASAASVAAAAVERAESQAVTYGASTITVLSLLEGVAGVANMGDSGFMLMRQTAEGMSTVLRSTEQQHSWNCPYQLMRLPPVLAKQAEKRGVRLDTAADSQIYEFPVLPGDLLLLFTDGLGDNLHEHEVLDICGRAQPPRIGRGETVGLATQPGDLAQALATAARERSQDPAAWVPFSEASQRHGYDMTGGKEDDITVVAAWVMPGEPRH
jgi:protein phosphatase PTC7